MGFQRFAKIHAAKQAGGGRQGKGRSQGGGNEEAAAPQGGLTRGVELGEGGGPRDAAPPELGAVEDDQLAAVAGGGLGAGVEKEEG